MLSITMDAGLNSNESFETQPQARSNCVTQGRNVCMLLKILVIFLVVKITQFSEDKEVFTAFPLNYFSFKQVKIL